jgi:predicted RNA polymerase sigma factor
VTLALNRTRDSTKGKREVTPQLPLKIDLPGYQLTCAARAGALGQLGECERAKDQLSQLIALRPDAAQSVLLELGKWHQPDLVEHWIEGLRKAGLEIPALKKEDQK